MADGAQWLSALAGCVSAGTAVMALYFVRRDKKEQPRNTPTIVLAPVPSVTPTNAPADPLVAEAIAIIHQHGVAHDQKMKQPVKRIFLAIPIIIAATAVQAWLTPDYAVLFLVVEFGVLISGVLYYANTVDAKLAEVVFDGNKKLAALVENPKFSLDTARQLRLTLKRYVAPLRVIIDVDDVIFEELGRRASKTHISVD